MVKDYRGSDYRPSVKTLENKFGTWNEAKRAAGLEITEHGMNNSADAAIRERRKVPPKLETGGRGYEYCRAEVDGVRKKIYIHRLLAVAEYGYDAVVGKEVHHKNGIPWDNRVENIVPLTATEHRRVHVD